MDKLSRKKHVLPIISLLLACVVLYANTFPNEFVTGDDTRLISDNRYIQRIKNIPLFFTPHYWNHLHPFKGERQYRPVRTTTFAFDYLFWGKTPIGYHLTNLLLHAGNVVLVYWMVLFLAGVAKSGQQQIDAGDDPDFVLPFLTALFFAAHPVHTEAIAFIKNRSELLACLFLVLSFLFFAFQTTPGKRRGAAQRSRWQPLFFPAALICFVLALFSKETAITLPALLILYAVCFLGGWPRFRAIIKTVPFWGVVLLFFWIRQGALVSAQQHNALTYISHWQYVSAVFQTFGYYFYLLLFPANLNVDHLFRLPSDWYELIVLLPFVAVLLTGMLVRVLYRRRQRIACFGLIWVLLVLLPVSNLVFLPARPIAEQRLYLPSLGFCLLMSLAFRGFVTGDKLLARRNAPILLIITAVLIFYSFQTIQRNRDWRDSWTMYLKLSDQAPHSARAQLGLGDALLGKGRPDEAINHYYKALCLKPNYKPAYNALGLALTAAGRSLEALSRYEEALKIDPADGDVHCNLGNLLVQKMDLDEAIAHYRLALAAQPDDPEIYYNLAVALAKQGKPEEAVQHYRQALTLCPDFPEALYNLGVLLAMRGRLDEAADNFNAALRLAPKHAGALRSLGMIAARKGFIQEAIQNYTAALAIEPNDAAAHLGLGIVLVGKGHTAEALKHYRLAVQYQPDYADAHYNLGMALAGKGLLAEASEHFESVIRINPDDAAAYNRLGDVYARMGDSDKADKYYDRAAGLHAQKEGDGRK